MLFSNTKLLISAAQSDAPRAGVDMLSHVDTDLKNIAARVIERAKELCISESVCCYQKTLQCVLCNGAFSFLMLFGITTILIDVNAAQSKLVLLENFNENYSKCLRLLYKVNAVEGVNAASKEVSTAELVSTAYVICMRYFGIRSIEVLKWDQQVVSELVALRNFARRYGSRFCTHGGCIQSSHAQTG
ncbi:hypothetical protein Tco_0929496 [Tanacetum coccineum]